MKIELEVDRTDLTSAISEAVGADLDDHNTFMNALADAVADVELKLADIDETIFNQTLATLAAALYARHPGDLDMAVCLEQAHDLLHGVAIKRIEAAKHDGAKK